MDRALINRWIEFVRSASKPWDEQAMNKSRSLRAAMTQAERNEADFLLVNV